jgi:hypothetical protein
MDGGNAISSVSLPCLNGLTVQDAAHITTAGTLVKYGANSTVKLMGVDESSLGAGNISGVAAGAGSLSGAGGNTFAAASAPTTIVGGSAPVHDITAAGNLRLDSQVGQLVQAMASFTGAHSGFDPVASTNTQLPNDPAQQTALANAWHH